jgi:hypothetical protein
VHNPRPSTSTGLSRTAPSSRPASAMSEGPGQARSGAGGNGASPDAFRGNGDTRSNGETRGLGPGFTATLGTHDRVHDRAGREPGFTTALDHPGPRAGKGPGFGSAPALAHSLPYARDPGGGGRGPRRPWRRGRTGKIRDRQDLGGARIAGGTAPRVPWPTWALASPLRYFFFFITREPRVE